jgi:DNA (cytosine-5)-methyltransferase 1
MNEEGEEGFSFPEGISEVHKYKQFGNSVTIPVIEEMAHFIEKKNYICSLSRR